MTTNTRLITLVVLACVAPLTAPQPPALAGDLDPPAGPVTETMLPLDEVEPRTPLDPADVPIAINSPGSYVLTGNIFASGFGQDAITINSENVTLDLRGFVIANSEVGQFDSGIVIDATAFNVSITNGSIIGCVSIGLKASGADDCHFSHLRITNNGGIGISVSGDATFRRCVAIGNGSTGLRCDSSASFEECYAESNTFGISCGDNSSVSGCNANNNSSGVGIAVGAGSSVVNCSSSNNDAGFFSSGGTTSFLNCAAESNTNSGFSPGAGSIVDTCTSQSNGLDGISASPGAIVRNCTARNNDRHGIFVSSDALVTGNLCDGNAVNDPAGAGIHLTPGTTDARIDGNTCTDNVFGIDCDGTGNLIVRNAASGNTSQFSIVGGNDVGTISVSPVGAGAWDNLLY